MSFECGLCEISTRQTLLIATCPEEHCPYKSCHRDLDELRQKPLSELSSYELSLLYPEDD